MEESFIDLTHNKCCETTSDVDIRHESPSSALNEIRLGMADQAKGFHWPDIQPLLTVYGMINEKECKLPILIDSGASANFVSGDFVSRHKLTTRHFKQPFKVCLADGKKMSAASALDRAVVHLPGMDQYRGRHQFMVLDDLQGYDAVLGRAFLVKSGAVVDHRNDSILYRDGSDCKKTDAVSWRSRMSVAEREINAEQDEHSIAITTPREIFCPSHPTVATSTENNHEVPHALNSITTTNPSSTPLQSNEMPSTASVDNQAGNDVTHEVGTAEQRARLQEVIDDYRSTLDHARDELPPSRGEYDHGIHLKNPDSKPVKQPPIKQRPELARAMKKKLDELLAKGMIRRSKSPYGAPAFMVEQDSMQDGKKVKKLRLVINYKKLNEQTETNATSLPHIDELFARLSKARVVSKMDLTNGFHQCRMRDEDIEKTAFTTPFGHYEWVVMPFGEKNAPATFVQLLAQDVLVDLVHDFIIVFVDDILIFSDNEEQHIDHVKQVLQKLSDKKMFINPEKCTWMVNEVDFLGYRLRTGDDTVEMMIQENKINAIHEWPVPTNISELRSFLGAANFSRSFIKNFSTIARPLTEATTGIHKSKSSVIIWGDAQQHAFDSLKIALTTAPRSQSLMRRNNSSCIPMLLILV